MGWLLKWISIAIGYQIGFSWLSDTVLLQHGVQGLVVHGSR